MRMRPRRAPGSKGMGRLYGRLATAYSCALVNQKKFACLLWTAAFLTLAVASGWFVHRRAPWGSAAVIGGLFGGVLLTIVLAWLLAVPDRIGEWWLIVKASLGGEPHDGKRVALIGDLRAHGELETPFTRQRCVAYAYEIHCTETRGRETTTRTAYEGFAMVPLSIEHGVERTRILAKPEIPSWPQEQPRGRAAEEHARRYVEKTEFQPATKAEEHDLSHSDGRLRYDSSHAPLETNIGACKLVERHLRGDIPVCVLGEYRAERRALLGPVTLRTGTSFAIGAAWRVVNAGIAAVIFATITLAIAALFCANFPLDMAEQSHAEWNFRWWEIDLERFVARHVRGPMVEAGMLSSPGFYLQELCDGCAKGRLEIDGRTIELKHAASVGGRSVHLSATPGHRDGVTLAGRNHVVLTVNGKSAEVPQSWLQEGDVVTSLGERGDYAGRVTVIAPDRWIRCRVSFQTTVDPGAFARKSVP